MDIRNDLDLIAPLVRLIQEMFRSLPLGDEAERLRVSVAVEEAIRNAIHHGNLEVGSAEAGQRLDGVVAERLWVPPYCNRNVRVIATVSHDEAVFTVQDEGPGFDYSAIECKDFDVDAHGGRGIRLMRTFMDEVQFSDRGRNVVLRKRRFEEADLQDDLA
ncbi:MAG: ATP-binding protein [Rhodopirellula sp.]|nr:ATP-binding protein [Rhodopirellula sp.]